MIAAAFLGGAWADQPAPERIELARPALAASAEQRQWLDYLVGCALPEGIELFVDVKGQRYTFAGSLGLAPGWLQRGLEPGEQRWVSACMLARTNYFGNKVPLSLRAPNPSVPELTTTAAERAEYTLFEGGFFGDLFAPRPVAYVCSGRPGNDPGAIQRVCTERTNTTAPDGSPLTRCGFVHVGSCGDEQRFSVGGVVYREVIFVYLRPAAAR